MEIKNLVKKQAIYQTLRLNKQTFSLYDESNYINLTFYTELNKKLQVYGKISTSAISIKTTNLIRPENSLKFTVLYNKYMDHIVLELQDIRKLGKIETKDAKDTIFSVLSRKSKRIVWSKEKKSYQLVDEFRIVGLQN